MTIFWSSSAIDSLREVYEFNRLASVSEKSARRLVSAILKHATKLEKHPFIGQVEVYLFERPQEFRYTVYKNYKIIYWVNMALNRVEISYIFDTRQRPSAMDRVKDR